MMNMKRSLFLCMLAFVFINMTAFAQQQEQDGLEKTGLFNTRYCEVIIIKDDFPKLNAAVYNSIGLNTCPTEQWNALNAGAIKKQFNASLVKLNGPRYLVMNSLIARDKTLNAQEVTIGGIRFKERADLSTYFFEATVGEKFYQPNKVYRDTVWLYNAGTRIYELIAPNHDVYIMQSYANIVDPTLKLADLISLGQRLTLPKGWHFRTRLLNKPLKLTATGIAYVINDNLYNSYQKVMTPM